MFSTASRNKCLRQHANVLHPETGIWQIILDFSGGILSDIQLVGDCYILRDWSGITGNLAKFLLGFVSIVFDTIFMLQHYVWYADRNTELIAEGDHVRQENLVELLL